METTPICASVEKDLDLKVDELVTSTTTVEPDPTPATKAES